MPKIPSPFLDAVFGNRSRGDTPEERAASSDQLFIRSQHQLSLARPGATGRSLNAVEALRLFGWDVLVDLVDRPATPLVRSGADPLKAIDQRLSDLGLEHEKAFKAAHWDGKIKQLFNERRQVPFQRLERLAQVIGLEPDQLGIFPEDSSLGVRLRELSKEVSKFSPATVLAFAEAAWVIRKQSELSELLGDHFNKEKFIPDSAYNSPQTPAWRKGFYLAEETRKILGITPYSPIDSMSRLMEERLGIPVVQVPLPIQIAGATIAVGGGYRGVVINTKGQNNNNVWVRRTTLAHELEHILWDPENVLQKLKVDSYGDIQTNFTKARDPIEQRANAFAVEFLAPQTQAVNKYLEGSSPDDCLKRVVQYFGIGLKPATYHVQNAIHAELSHGHIDCEPSSDLTAREELSVSYFPPSCVPESRRGRFAVLVGRAVRGGLISEDTAASLLACPRDQIKVALNFLNQLERPPGVSLPQHR